VKFSDNESKPRGGNFDICNKISKNVKCIFIFIIQKLEILFSLQHKVRTQNLALAHKYLAHTHTVICYNTHILLFVQKLVLQHCIILNMLLTNVTNN